LALAAGRDTHGECDHGGDADPRCTQDLAHLFLYAKKKRLRP
jgi:hypothetical protein